jgi:hypothetical protein
VSAANATWIQNIAILAFAPAFSGFVNGDTPAVLSGSPNLSTTATISSAIGTYAINVAAGTLAASNYSFDFVAGTLNVIQTPLAFPAGADQMSTIAGTGVYGSTGIGGPAISAEIYYL